MLLMNVLTYFDIFIKVVCFYLMYLYNGLQKEIFLGWGCKRLSSHNAPAGALYRRVMEQARYGYLTVPFTPPPQNYFTLQPIVQVHKIKTHNFYEIKVDF
jgi:hypothetical protein